MANRVFGMKNANLATKIFPLQKNASIFHSFLIRNYSNRVLTAAHFKKVTPPFKHRRSSLVKTLHTSGIVRQPRTALIEDDIERLYSNIAVEVKGSDEAVLDSYCQFVSRAAAVLNFDISGKIVLPTHLEKHTLLKSPHIYKKHMAQYEIRTYKRMLQLKHLTGPSADTFLEYIQRNIPEGVSMIVEQTELHPLPEFIKSNEVSA